MAPDAEIKFKFPASFPDRLESGRLGLSVGFFRPAWLAHMTDLRSEGYKVWRNLEVVCLVAMMDEVFQQP
jgi:hypothetical protein